MLLFLSFKVDHIGGKVEQLGLERLGQHYLTIIGKLTDNIKQRAGVFPLHSEALNYTRLPDAEALWKGWSVCAFPPFQADATKVF